MTILIDVAGWLLNKVGERLLERFVDHGLEKVGIFEATCKTCKHQMFDIAIPEKQKQTLVCPRCNNSGEFLIESLDTLTIHRVVKANIVVESANIIVTQGNIATLNSFGNNVKLLKESYKISLQAHNGQYVCAEYGGGREIVANRKTAGDWEMFSVIALGENKIGLRAYYGQYVCAEGGGGRELIANRNWLEGWETFKLVYLENNEIALQVHNGQYVCAEGGGGREVVANRDAIYGWETFKLTKY